MQLLEVDRTLLEEDPALMEDNLDAVAGIGLDIIGRGSDVAGR